jgi:hypothetical protein
MQFGDLLAYMESRSEAMAASERANLVSCKLTISQCSSYVWLRVSARSHTSSLDPVVQQQSRRIEMNQICASVMLLFLLKEIRAK